MSLTDWTTEAIVTPRAMSSLFTGEEFLAFTQRSHRGSSTFVYRWGGPGEHRKVGTDQLQTNSNTLVDRCGSQVVLRT